MAENPTINGFDTVGATADRPTEPPLGHLYFDTDLDCLLTWTAASGGSWKPAMVPKVSSLPATDAYPAGTVVYLTTDASLYVLTGGSWGLITVSDPQSSSSTSSSSTTSSNSSSSSTSSSSTSSSSTSSSQSSSSTSS